MSQLFLTALCLLLSTAKVPGGSGQIWNTDMGRQFYWDCGRVEHQHPSGWPYWKQGGYPPEYSRRIAGGWVPHDDQFPPFYRIRVYGSGFFAKLIGAGQACGAALIDEQRLLTAAHCVVDAVEQPENVYAQSEHYAQLGDNFSDRRGTAVCVHRNYRLRHKQNNDVAVVKLDRPVDLNEYTQPTCLPSEFPVSDVITYMIGTGRDESGQMTPHLKALPLYKYGDPYERGCPSNNSNNIVCWGSSLRRMGVGCAGDSGSPLLRINEKDGRLTTYGVYSSGTTNVCSTAIRDKSHFAANLYQMLLDGDIQDMVSRCS